MASAMSNDGRVVCAADGLEHAIANFPCHTALARVGRIVTM